MIQEKDLAPHIKVWLDVQRGDEPHGVYMVRRDNGMRQMCDPQVFHTAQCLGVYSPCDFNMKGRNKEFAQQVGIGVAKLKRIFNYLNFEAIVGDVVEAYNTLSFFRRQQPHVTYAQKCRDTKHLWAQALHDGLKNIVPLIVMSGKSPSELKAHYKGAWKHLAKNSLHRNSVIAANVSPLWWGDTAHVRTTLLAGGRWFYAEDTPLILSTLANLRDRTLKCVISDQNFITLVVDTVRMAGQLGETYNPKWSRRKILEKHDEFAKEVTRRKYPDTPFTWMDGKLPAIETENFIAQPLTSPAAIAAEGAAMGHCVASYIDSVYAATYIVYSVKSRSTGARSSTIGFRQTYSEEGRKIVPWCVDQHFGKYNSRVTNQEEASIPSMLFEKLTEIFTQPLDTQPS